MSASSPDMPIEFSVGSWVLEKFADFHFSDDSSGLVAISTITRWSVATAIARLSHLTGPGSMIKLADATTTTAAALVSRGDCPSSAVTRVVVVMKKVRFVSASARSVVVVVTWMMWMSMSSKGMDIGATSRCSTFELMPSGSFDHSRDF